MLTKILLTLSLAVMSLPTTYAKPIKQEKKMKALIVVTSHNKLGNTGKLTGYYLPEVSHPTFQLLGQGIEVDFASPQGGKAPVDEGSLKLDDSANARFLASKDLMYKIEHTLKISEVDPSEYQAIFFAGGHGTMWDFAQTPAITKIAEAIYAQGGIISAVCHGPAALINLKNPDGSPLVKGKTVAAFSNDEEEAAEMTKIVPFLLETEFKKLGAKYEKAPLWQAKVVVSERLITGQNPASAEGVGAALASMMKTLK